MDIPFEKIITWTTFIFYIFLLGMAVYLLVVVYVCDSETCKPFTDAEEKGEKGSKEFTIDLLDNTVNDGMWPFAYVGATILTALTLWFWGINITARLYGIVFITSFLVIYALFVFFAHHYLWPIKTYVADFIDQQCVCYNNNVVENE